MSDDGGKQLGTRERAKAERRRRLKSAALSVFLEKGYEVATTREIAERAGVGVATLFRYAEEKRDLLLMIVNDDLIALNAEAFAKLDPRAPLVEALLVLFKPRYLYWSGSPALAREATHVTVLARADGDTFETQRYRSRRNHLLATITELVRRHQAGGTVRDDYDPEFLAEFFLDVYIAQRRHWLADPKPDAAIGIDVLRRMLELAIEGVGAKRGHARGQRRRA
jgi:AcrR family transcriptional regulator